MRKFSERHNLPHINPHAFRHTVASTLIFNHVDDVTLSSRLGHYSSEFTKKQYGHLMEKADRMNADILADVFLKKAWLLNESWIISYRPKTKAPKKLRKPPIS